MTKYDVWIRIYDSYCVTLEADSDEQMYDMVYENYESDFLGRSWVDGGVVIDHYQEVTDD